MVLVSLALTPVGAFAQSEPTDEPYWIVNVWGTTVHRTTRVGNDPDTEFHSLSVAKTEGQAKFLFDVAPDGSIIETGDGLGLYYPDPTWHLEGSYDGVSFNCDPPVAGSGLETTTITGTATESEFNFTLDLPNASEHNDDMECSENFTAFATTSQDLRDSLLFCGAVRVAYADYAETSCKKTQVFFEDMSSPTSGRIKREITHDWILTIRLRNPEQSPTPSASPSTDPSPTPSPTPRPSPTEDGPSTNTRASLMILERHLRASGAVTLAGWGDADCVSSVPVKLQRRRADGSWATAATVTTDEAGLWSRPLRDRSGPYRALAPEVMKGQATCRQAVSGIKRHKHRR
jgi:hypothetical protein